MVPRGKRLLTRFALLAAGITAILVGCYGMRPNAGGGEATFTPPRRVDSADIALPAGYRIEAVATGLTFPTGVAVDESGTPYVTESGYSYGEAWTEPRLLRIEPDGRRSVVARGGRNGPWNGVAYADGHFFVSEGGQLEGGRILRIERDGKVEVLVKGLPSMGDHHTNGPAIGPDGAVYFAQGVVTNSAIVGEDNAQFGWLKRFPTFHDIPCEDIRLAGVNYESKNPLGEGQATTGAYSPFGTPTSPGQVIRGQIPCSGAIFKVAPRGGEIELIAWGLRNPYGLGFGPGGRLFVTENGYDDRGSRPLWGTPDLLWEVKRGAWYGWPDFSAGLPLNADDFTPPGKERPELLLAAPPRTPPRPTAVFGVHSSSNGFDFSTNPAFGHVGQAFVAQLGDETPTTGKALHPVGFKVVRVEIGRGVIEDFAVNRGERHGPASLIGGGGLERPVAARFDPAGRALYVVDFGVLTHSKEGARPYKETGVLWKITREAGR